MSEFKCLLGDEQFFVEFLQFFTASELVKGWCLTNSTLRRMILQSDHLWEFEMNHRFPYLIHKVNQWKRMNWVTERVVNGMNGLESKRGIRSRNEQMQLVVLMYCHHAFHHVNFGGRVMLKFHLL